MNRPVIKKILEDASLGVQEKMDQIFAVYTASMQRYKTDEFVQKAVEEAVSEAAAGFRAEDTPAYQALERSFADYKLKEELIRGGVKEKFLEDAMVKIDPDGDAAEQIGALKEEFGEFFEASPDPKAEDFEEQGPNTQTLTPNTRFFKEKPVFSAPAGGSMPTGESGQTFADLWGLRGFSGEKPGN